jgi:hypothetical protein
MPGEAPKRPGDQWKFDTAASVEWLRQRERQSALGEIATIDEGEAKRRKIAAEAAMAELELAKAEEQAIGLQDFAKAWAGMIGSARAKLLGLGSKLGPGLAIIEDAAECSSIVDAGISEALQELSEFEPEIRFDAESDKPKLRAEIRRVQRLWAPPPDLTVSEWADAERKLSSESSAEPGEYKTSRTEYMRGVMDAFSDPKVKRVVGVFSAQVAKTTVIENVIGYHVQHDPSPIMVVQPTLEIAEAFSKDRLAPMARDTPALRAKFAAAGSKTSGDTLLHKKFPGGHITLAGANSYNSLASRPIRIVLGDEAAKWKANEKGPRSVRSRLVFGRSGTRSKAIFRLPQTLIRITSSINSGNSQISGSFWSRAIAVLSDSSIRLMKILQVCRLMPFFLGRSFDGLKGYQPVKKMAGRFAAVPKLGLSARLAADGSMMASESARF